MMLVYQEACIFPPWEDPPTSGGVVTLQTGKQEVPGSIPGRACRPSRLEFSVVFFETRVNME